MAATGCCPASTCWSQCGLTTWTRTCSICSRSSRSRPMSWPRGACCSANLPGRRLQVRSWRRLTEMRAWRCSKALVTAVGTWTSGRRETRAMPPQVLNRKAQRQNAARQRRPKGWGGVKRGRRAARAKWPSSWTFGQLRRMRPAHRPCAGTRCRQAGRRSVHLLRTQTIAHVGDC